MPAERTRFNDVQYRYPMYTPAWWYGMVLIGDGALTRCSFLPDVSEPDMDGDGDVDGSDLAELAGDPTAVELIDFAQNFGRL